MLATHDQSATVPFPSSIRAPAEACGRVLIVDDNARARQSMAEVLRHADHEVSAVGSGQEALQKLAQEAFDVVVTDLQMPGMDGLALIREIVSRGYDVETAMVTAHATITAAVEAMRHGAFDFIEKPFDADQLEQLVARALRHGKQCGRRSSVPAAASCRSLLLGESPAAQRLRELILQAGPTDATALISGESGVGKELVARALHAASRRQGQALVSLNCPALSPQLVESELFGHERGAFTSADAPRVGRFELAEGGTILLDEISEIEPSLQAKLLRVLQERTYERVGSSKPRPTDVRVLATTNRDLKDEIQRGRFRQDLYFRLAVVPIHVAPLRERREDIGLLLEHFLHQAAQRMNSQPCRLSGESQALLRDYHWPGNVRELENLATRASVLFAGREASVSDLREWLDPAALPAGDAPSAPVATTAGASGSLCRLEDMEQQLIEAALEKYDGHRIKAAQALGIGVRTLTNKLRQYGYAPRAKSFGKAA